MLHAKSFTYNTKGKHANNDSHFFCKIVKAKEGGRVFGFGHELTVSRAAQRLYAAHDKANSYC